MSNLEASYIDYEAFLSPEFSAENFANTLVTSTNNPSDTTIDLSTPLSRVLFDLQEIDTHINSLTTKSALPLLNHTKGQSEASSQILAEVDSQLAILTKSYSRLEKEVLQKHHAADEAHTAAQNSWETLRLGRTVARYLSLSRQLEAQINEALPKSLAKEDFSALLRASHTLLQLRGLIDGSSDPSSEGYKVARINIVKSLQSDLTSPSESRILSKAQQTIREFNVSSLSSTSAQSSTTPSSTATPTFSQTSHTKIATSNALTILALLSEPTLLSTLTTYLSNALTSSLSSLTRSLSTLSSNTLPRTLLEASTRCQNIVALETLLSTHPMSLLPRLLTHLDTSSLPSYFWRSLAAGLEPRVAEIVNRGGAQARLLKKEKDRVRESLRECVLRGSQMPKGVEIGGRGGGEGGFVVGGWEREAAVMAAAVLGALGR
ncbi:MAG: hypothetical protein Q9160_000265 [Pyrenula sp. 1 TL-2023]